MTGLLSDAALSMRALADGLGRARAEARLEHTLAQLSAAELAALEYEWEFWARPDQRMPPGDWRVWLALAGRGWGKTRTFAEAVQGAVQREEITRVALISATDEDAVKVMVNGKKSGLMAIAPPWCRPELWQTPSLHLRWPNGAIGYIYSGEAPDRIRGEEFDWAWWDEVAAARRTAAAIMYNLRFALRGSDNARLLMSTTPKRGLPMLHDLVAQSRDGSGRVVVSRGSTLDNAANLPKDFIADVRREYEGTQIGRQELGGELLDDDEDCLFRQSWISDHRVEEVPDLVWIVIAVDPAISSRHGSDETGIVVVGRGTNGHAYILEDASGRHTMDAWPAKVAKLYRDWGADLVVVETNRGGEMPKKMLQNECPSLPVEEVRAQHQKEVRADPVARFYERGFVHHVGRDLDALEAQMTGWNPKLDTKSPDRLDAMVWGVWRAIGSNARTGFAGFAEANGLAKRAAPTEGRQVGLGRMALPALERRWDGI